MEKSIKLPELFFDARGGGYFLKVAARRFLNLTAAQVRRHLVMAGLVDEKSADGGLSTTERVLTVAESERYVDYAGPLAGHRVGRFTTTAEERILVTSEPAAFVFEKSASRTTKAPFLEKYIGALLGPEQSTYALLWLAFAMRSLRRGDFMPGQLVVLAGPPKCGKSFFHVLITELLGGRMAKPYLFMSGKTSFNAEIAGAESLVIEDDQASTDIRSRLAFKAAIKQMTVNESFHVHAKGRQGIVLSTYKRLSLSCNWEAENLAILPPMDEDVLDKTMLFKCEDARSVLSTDRKENVERLRAEMPAFRAYLETLRCPKAWRDDRFGVAAYHNPELLEATNALAPETRLLNLIDEILFSTSKQREEPWDGSAEELERQLRNSPFAPAIDKLLSFSSACGSYLGRLAARSQRVEARKVKGKTKWIVRAP